MKHSLVFIKWFCRVLLFSLGAVMTYVAVQPSYNFAHWVPHDLLREIGVPYSFVLWGESNADVALHFVGAACLVYLLYCAKIPYCNRYYSCVFVLLLCLLAELVQWHIGRGFDSSDLLLGMLGSFMAYLEINKNKTGVVLE